MLDLKFVFAEIDKATAHGERVLEDGTRLVGHVPHVAREAYFHLVYPPLQEEDIDAVEEELGSRMPPSLRAFFRVTNGLGLFSDQLALYGMRRSFERTGDEARQPYCIVSANTYETPDGLPARAILVGSYRRDGTHLFIDPDQGERVFRCGRYEADVLNEWAGLEDMLTREVQRLAKLYDVQGRKLDPDRPTTPEE